MFVQIKILLPEIMTNQQILLKEFVMFKKHTFIIAFLQSKNLQFFTFYGQYFIGIQKFTQTSSLMTLKKCISSNLLLKPCFWTIFFISNKASVHEPIADSNIVIVLRDSDFRKFKFSCNSLLIALQDYVSILNGFQFVFLFSNLK